jgi:hypothetical protein
MISIGWMCSPARRVPSVETHLIYIGTPGSALARLLDIA